MLMKIMAIGVGTQVTFYGVRFLVFGPTWIALRWNQAGHCHFILQVIWTWETRESEGYTHCLIRGPMSLPETLEMDLRKPWVDTSIWLHIWLWYFWDEAVLARLRSLLKTWWVEKRAHLKSVDSGQRSQRRETDLQHELHADSVFYQSHHQVSFTLEHLVVLPGQRVGVLDGEVKVRGGAEETQHVLPSQHYNTDERFFWHLAWKSKSITCPSLCPHWRSGAAELLPSLVHSPRSCPTPKSKFH